ncbi:MAG: thiolase family protein [Saprospiraceae bacterium]|nr:thiolase family protein [Saprospiraceae bacterium]
MAYIVKAYRTAITKAKKGSFRHMRSDDLAVQVIKYMMQDTPEINADMINDVIVGCAFPEGEQGLNMGRGISLAALGIKAPGTTVNRFCASGLETIAMACGKIDAGYADMIIAGGAESMTMVPMTGYKLAANYNIAYEIPESLAGMGITAEAVAKKYNINRADSDVFAYNSHMKAAKALETGRFKSQIVPVAVKEINVIDDKRIESEFIVSVDEGVRKETTVEALSQLKPVFAVDGVVTAGNSSQTSDGAAFVLVVSDKMVKELNLKPIARLIGYGLAGVEPLYMGIGPVAAVPAALKNANLKINDIGLIELNEAFSAQSLAVLKELDLDQSIVNVNGGAIALGHPLGCTGAKLSTQLIYEAHDRGVRYGMVTACIGFGQGIAGIYEML